MHEVNLVSLHNQRNKRSSPILQEQTYRNRGSGTLVQIRIRISRIRLAPEDNWNQELNREVVSNTQGEDKEVLQQLPHTKLRESD